MECGMKNNAESGWKLTVICTDDKQAGTQIKKSHKRYQFFTYLRDLNHSAAREMEEAAFIDGCGRVGSFFRLILPLSRPIILSVALIMFLSTWSQFQIPLILASSMETKPMAIVISEFVTKDSVQYGLVAAAGMLALVPPALAAFIFRKYLVTGMTNGSVKG